MEKRKSHTVQLIIDGSRYVALEEHGNISLSRDGLPFATAVWQKDQLLDLSVPIKDHIVHELEKLIKERMDKNWDED